MKSNLDRSLKIYSMLPDFSKSGLVGRRLISGYIDEVNIILLRMSNIRSTTKRHLKQKIYSVFKKDPYSLIQRLRIDIDLKREYVYIYDLNGPQTILYLKLYYN